MPPLKTIPKNCEHCGKQFSRKRYKNEWEGYSRYQKRKFCSHSCSVYKKKPTVRASRWRTKKVISLVACEHCGTEHGLGVHHKDENPMNNKQENLSVLCRACHSRWHGRLRKYGTSSQADIRQRWIKKLWWEIKKYRQANIGMRD